MLSENSDLTSSQDFSDNDKWEENIQNVVNRPASAQSNVKPVELGTISNDDSDCSSIASLGTKIQRIAMNQRHRENPVLINSYVFPSKCLDFSEERENEESNNHPKISLVSPNEKSNNEWQKLLDENNKLFIIFTN